MKELTKVFNGQELPVEMINDKEFMVDISGIAHKYEKTLQTGRGLRVLKIT